MHTYLIHKMSNWQSQLIPRLLRVSHNEKYFTSVKSQIFRFDYLSFCYFKDSPLPLYYRGNFVLACFVVIRPPKSRENVYRFSHIADVQLHK